MNPNIKFMQTTPNGGRMALVKDSVTGEGFWRYRNAELDLSLQHPEESFNSPAEFMGLVKCWVSNEENGYYDDGKVEFPGDIYYTDGLFHLTKIKEDSFFVYHNCDDMKYGVGVAKENGWVCPSGCKPSTEFVDVCLIAGVK